VASLARGEGEGEYEYEVYISADRGTRRKDLGIGETAAYVL
jgi:hypothetical protein